MRKVVKLNPIHYLLFI